MQTVFTVAFAQCTDKGQCDRIVELRELFFSGISQRKNMRRTKLCDLFSHRFAGNTQCRGEFRPCGPGPELEFTQDTA